MESLERNVAPEDTQSQWVGEAAIKGKSQVSQSVSTFPERGVDER